MEIVLSEVVCIFGPSGGPKTGLFNRFQKEWPSIKQGDYVAAADELFQHPVLRRLRQEMLDYLPHALVDQQPRDGY